MNANAINLLLKKASPLYAKIISATLIIISTFSFLNARAQGDLFINPKRVVFEGTRGAQEITLANIGKDTARYAISLIQIRMKDDGNFEQIEQPDSGQSFATQYLRIFPRTVTLAPKETQVVKVQINQNFKLLPGEYRSHLYFRGVPNENILGAPAIKKEEKKEVSVKLTPIYGITIPVIIRVGESNVKLGLSNLMLEKGETPYPVLKLRLNRTGNMSVYGDITIEHISDAGKITTAALIKGLSVYTPNKIRDLKLRLFEKNRINYQSGRLRVVYTSFTNGKPEKLASAELKLN